MPENPASIDNDFLCFSVEKKFISRKNSVFLVKAGGPGATERYLVCKKYSRPERMAGEAEMLRLLKEKGVSVPQIYGTGKDYILTEYLEGTLLLDRYCLLESSGSDGGSPGEPASRLLRDLCRWFKGFYQASREIAGRQLIMGDVNFRNFIVREKIYGIDLEECREGEIEEDVGSLCAYALTYTPSFTLWKMALVREMLWLFAAELGLDQEFLKREVKKELLVLAGRRGTLAEMKKLLAGNLLEKRL
ncbi:MAG: hypothetical protein PWP44_983 [Thermacetogenium sp.]|nr:hypothetical protein [Thermacetogenium sp.]